MLEDIGAMAQSPQKINYEIQELYAAKQLLKCNENKLLSLQKLREYTQALPEKNYYRPNFEKQRDKWSTDPKY